MNKDITKGYIRGLESQIKFLEDLVVGGLYRHITTDRVFVLLQFEMPGSGLFDGRRRHLEAWKIMTDEKVETVWLWEGNYKKLECTPSHTKI